MEIWTDCIIGQWSPAAPHNKHVASVALLRLQVRRYRPIFGYIAVCLAMSERVEATLSKVVVWVGGTAVGGEAGEYGMGFRHGGNCRSLQAASCLRRRGGGCPVRIS